MGVLQNGKWQHSDEINSVGEFVRAKSKLAGAQATGVVSSMSQEVNRYYLIASKSCPWSHRVTIMRTLKGLGNIMPLHYAGGPRVEGYALKGDELWAVPGTEKKIRHLHQLYSLSDGEYTGKATVPVLWDSYDQIIISNESSDIARALNSVRSEYSLPDFTLVPDKLRFEIDQANSMIYDGLNNAVYQAGFARSQSAYDDAVNRVFYTLDGLENRLQKSRYYFGGALSETDWRIFPTLCRFDAIYHILFKCSKRRLVDYPALWAYARDLYQTKGIAETIDFEAMRTASYLNDSSSENPIIAIQPDADWSASHGREALGATHVFSREGEEIAIDPKVFQ